MLAPHAPYSTSTSADYYTRFIDSHGNLRVATSSRPERTPDQATSSTRARRDPGCDGRFADQRNGRAPPAIQAPARRLSRPTDRRPGGTRGSPLPPPPEFQRPSALARRVRSRSIASGIVLTGSSGGGIAPPRVVRRRNHASAAMAPLFSRHHVQRYGGSGATVSSPPRDQEHAHLEGDADRQPSAQAGRGRIRHYDQGGARGKRYWVVMGLRGGLPHPHPPPPLPVVQSLPRPILPCLLRTSPPFERFPLGLLDVECVRVRPSSKDPLGGSGSAVCTYSSLGWRVSVSSSLEGGDGPFWGSGGSGTLGGYWAGESSLLSVLSTAGAVPSLRSGHPDWGGPQPPGSTRSTAPPKGKVPWPE